MSDNSPLEFHFVSLPQDIICGPEAISGMGATLDRLGARRAMVVCGPSILEGSDVVQRVPTTDRPAPGIDRLQLGSHPFAAGFHLGQRSTLPGSSPIKGKPVVCTALHPTSGPMTAPGKSRHPPRGAELARKLCIEQLDEPDEPDASHLPQPLPPHHLRRVRQDRRV